MMEIVVATRNRGKVAEIAAVLAALPVRVLSLEDFPITAEAEEKGETFAANAIMKATHYSLATGKPCLADDSGLETDALGGEPGVYSARYAGPEATDAENNARLLAALAAVADEDRTARFRCVLAFVDPQGSLLTADGTCEGRILRAPRGDGGFGYDPLFFVPATGRTLAEMTLAEKNGISHRGQALRNMAGLLAGYFHENRCC